MLSRRRGRCLPVSAGDSGLSSSSSPPSSVAVFHQLAGDPITHIFRRRRSRCSLMCALAGRQPKRKMMGDMGCCLPACLRAIRRRSPLAACSLSLCPSGVYWYYTLWERKRDRDGDREMGSRWKGDGGGTAHFIKHRYTQHG